MFTTIITTSEKQQTIFEIGSIKKSIVTTNIPIWFDFDSICCFKTWWYNMYMMQFWCYFVCLPVNAFKNYMFQYFQLDPVK